MTPNPMLGVLFHWLGGLFSASFYVPYKRIQRWSWEIFWLAGGIFSWFLCPWFFAWIQTEDLLGVLGATDMSTLQQCFLWGLGWGFGGLTFGLAVRYMGISSGMAIVLGLTTVLGTLANLRRHNWRSFSHYSRTVCRWRNLNDPCGRDCGGTSDRREKSKFGHSV